MQNILNQYKDLTLQAINNIDSEDLSQIVFILHQALADNKQVFTMGNGGSAATANHIVNDLTQIKKKFKSQSPIISLTSNASVLTCIGNDIGYEYIFSKQLEGSLHASDIVIAYSVSGNSPNILNAIDSIKQAGATLISFTGFAGGELAEKANHRIHIPGEAGNYGVPEALHLFYSHLICDLLRSQVDGQ